MSKKITFLGFSLVVFAVLAITAFVFGVKEVSQSAEVIKSYQLKRFLFISGEENQFAYQSPYYRTVLYAYWYLASFLFTFILFKSAKLIKVLLKRN